MWRYSKIGFTIIELLIAIGVMAVLSAGVMTAIGPGPRQSARDARRKADLEKTVSALEIFRSDTGTYPACNPVGSNCLISATSGFTANYLPTVPTDPSSGRNYAYFPTDAGGGTCNATAADKCIRYDVCASLEKDYASLPMVVPCNATCGTNCNYKVSGP